MLVYRLSKTQYAHDLEGTGSKLFGGRWNHKDVACIYTSESAALAVLEYSVNINIDFIQRALSLCTYEINADLIHVLSHASLPGDWKDLPAPLSTKTMGTHWLRSGKPILKIPSTVIPFEFNYVLNPDVQEAFRLVEVKDFVYDLRIKQNF